MQHFEPDTLVRNPVGNPVVASVSVNGDARSVWNVVGDFAGFIILGVQLLVLRLRSCLLP